MGNPFGWFLLYMTVINAITFLFYGVDKWRAVHGKWRISEKNLLGMALLGGSLGAFFGMQVFHHKTKHFKFRILIPLFLILHIAIGAVIYHN